MVAQIDRFDNSSVRLKSSKPSSSKVIVEALKIAATGRRVLVVQLLKGGLHQGEGHMVNLAQNLDWIRSDVDRQLCQDTMIGTETKPLQQLWRYVKPVSYTHLTLPSKG